MNWRYCNYVSKKLANISVLKTVLDKLLKNKYKFGLDSIINNKRGKEQAKQEVAR